MCRPAGDRRLSFFKDLPMITLRMEARIGVRIRSDDPESDDRRVL
jgi:hypothetical protein